MIAKSGVLLWVVVLLAASSFAYSAGEREIEGPTTFSERELVTIELGSGDVTVNASQMGEIRVTVEYTYSPNVYRPIFVENVRQLVLKEEFSRSGLSTVRGYSKWTVMVPPETRIRCSTGSGAVAIEGVRGAMRVTTGSGTVAIEGGRSGISVNTGSGTVEVTGFGGDLEVGTGSGRVSVEDYEGNGHISTGSGRIIVTRANGHLQGSTGSGGMELDLVTGSVRASSGSGNIIVTGVKIEKPSSFNAGSGNVEVTLGDSPANDISLGTGSGKATLDYGGNPIRGHFVLSALQRKGRIESPFSFDQETTFTPGGQTYDQKSFTRGASNPQVIISTGSGLARLVR